MAKYNVPKKIKNKVIAQNLVSKEILDEIIIPKLKDFEYVKAKVQYIKEHHPILVELKVKIMEDFWKTDNELTDDGLYLVFNIVLQETQPYAIFHKRQFEYVRAELYDRINDYQGRHLSSQFGYNILLERECYVNKITDANTILDRGYASLVDYHSVSNRYQKLKRIDMLGLDWAAKCAQANYRCLTCGDKEGEMSRWYGKVIQLTRAHYDPTKSPTDDNIFPQCDGCNRAYKDSFFLPNGSWDRNKTIQYANRFSVGEYVEAPSWNEESI